MQQTSCLCLNAMVVVVVWGFKWSCGHHMIVLILALFPHCSPALWTLQGYVYILVSGHSLPEVPALAPFSPSWSGIAGA